MLGDVLVFFGGGRCGWMLEGVVQAGGKMNAVIQTINVVALSIF
jgi:hypothetical protein